MRRSARNWLYVLSGVCAHAPPVHTRGLQLRGNRASNARTGLLHPKAHDRRYVLCVDGNVCICHTTFDVQVMVICESCINWVVVRWSTRSASCHYNMSCRSSTMLTRSWSERQACTPCVRTIAELHCFTTCHCSSHVSCIR
jgi:hypothetical protein